MIIPKNAPSGKLRYTGGMHKPVRSEKARRIAANYIGGLGYYGWFFALVLLFAQLGVQAAQYFVVPATQPVRDVPMSVAKPQMPGAEKAGVIMNAAAVSLVLVAVVGVLVMPYYVGWLSRHLPRWVVAQTNHHKSSRALHMTKQTGCLVLAVVSTLLLFAPYESGLTNALYVTALGSLFAAAALFWLQYKTVTLWQIPERDVF